MIFTLKKDFSCPKLNIVDIQRKRKNVLDKLENVLVSQNNNDVFYHKDKQKDKYDLSTIVKICIIENKRKIFSLTHKNKEQSNMGQYHKRKELWF